MTAVRDSLCNLEPVQIPRPQISGLQFIPTRGRLGFYKSIRRDGEKYGVEMKPIGPRRPALADACFLKDGDTKQSSSTSSVPSANPSNCTQMQNSTKASPNQNSGPKNVQKSNALPAEPSCPEPDYDTSNSRKTNKP